MVLFSTIVFSQTFKAKVIKVYDGDTITVLTDNYEQVKIRVADIDCPERGQSYGKKATDFTKQLTLSNDGNVIIHQKDTDKYGRAIAFVEVDGVDLSSQLLLNGYAWFYEKYSDLEEFRVYENQARLNKKGLWQDDKAIAPWNFRKLKREGKIQTNRTYYRGKKGGCFYYNSNGNKSYVDRFKCK